MPSSAAAASAVARLREAIATTSVDALASRIAGTSFSVAIRAVDRMPQRTGVMASPR